MDDREWARLRRRVVLDRWLMRITYVGIALGVAKGIWHLFEQDYGQAFRDLAFAAGVFLAVRWVDKHVDLFKITVTEVDSDDDD